MTLHFMTTWPDKMVAIKGKPTYFVEKMAGSIKKEFGDHLPAYYQPEDYDMMVQLDCKNKIHTIRADKKNRWKAGKGIHFKTWTGKPYRSKTFQFAPVIKCKSVQTISIIYDEDLCEKYGSEPAVLVGGKVLWIDEIDQLAINDGFDNTTDFFNWFDSDFEGKIIHWTDYKY